nr:MAG TPA: hypothetical protein [Caudoviricetes sp.]
MAWTLFDTFSTPDKLTDLVQTKPSKFKKKGCEKSLFLIDIIALQKQSQRSCWCRWLEGGDRRLEKHPKNKHLFNLFNKIS